jgi:hypothetical protein
MIDPSVPVLSPLETLRHSAAHVMAAAIKKLWPDAKLAFGPHTEEGFYYDIDMAHRLVPEDFEKIEAACRPRSTASTRSSARRSPARRRSKFFEGAERDLQGRGDRRDPQGRHADALPQRRLRRPVPRPARQQHRPDPGLQADEHRRRVLARRRVAPDAAARLRDRLRRPQGAQGVPAPARGGEGPRPPQARQGARPVPLRPDRPGQPVLHRPRRDRLQPAAGLRAQAVPPHGYEEIITPQIFDMELFTPPATTSTTRTTCSRARSTSGSSA